MAATYCLIPKLANEFKQRLKDGRIDPAKLNEMTSKERHAFFEEFLGKDNALNVNALFESKLLLKNQQQGMITWAKTVTGIKEAVKRDMISKIERLDKVLNPSEQKAFLSDLAEKRLGIEVTLEEANTISKATKDIAEKKAAIDPKSPAGSPERIEYGLATTLLKEQIGEMKLSGEKMSVKDYMQNPTKAFMSLANITKSVLSTLDNSFFGRQGIKTLYTHPTVWFKNFIKSWSDIGKELKGQDAMLPIKADVFSRPNALNGKYEAMKLDIGLLTEEAFPSFLPARIPGFGRIFKGAESAFNGAALRIRADLADLLIKKAEKAGVDMLDPFQAESVGKLINSMTGRGKVNLTPGQSNFVNSTVFSIKFLKSNFDTLTMHGALNPFNKKMSKFSKKEAALNMAKIVATIAAINLISESLHPGSTEKDPRSSNFGKIKIKNTTFDLTGGMGSLVALASRITPTVHDGELGFWSKNPVSGKYTKLNSGKYGARTVENVIVDFLEGKASPIAGAFRDVWLKGVDYQRRKPTVPTVAQNLFTPLPVQTWMELMNDPESANDILSIIADGLGFGTNTISNKK
jgi:hypothetical protein